MRERRYFYVAIQEMIDSFDRYMSSAQGFAVSTREVYCSNVRVFLRFQFKAKGRIDCIQAKDVIKFILSYSRNGGLRRAQHMVYSLRSFFRFLQQTQGLKEDLLDCIPSVVVWKQLSYPVTLSVHETQQLLNSCNRNSEIGLRNFAVLMLLTQLGLRASEVCRITLNDIDWDKSEIIIRGKGLTQTRFPIFNDLGKALVDYLQYSRPNCANNNLFICTDQPIRGFKSSSTVRSILRGALKRAGLNPERKGTHLLRHSFATQLLQQGATYPEIAMILRHKSINTTAIYAKVDFDKLRILALPWPHNHQGGGSL
jgi:site-specific recombinase XerD